MIEKRSPKIVFASANLADPRQRQFFMARPADLGRFATQHGFDGVELLVGPFDWLLARPNQVAAAVEDGDLALNSIHAAFRVTRRSWETHTPGGVDSRNMVSRALATPVGRLLMPEIVDSAAKAGRIQKRVGPRPVVLYPQSNPKLDRRAAESAAPGLRLYQANDHVAHLVGARTPEELVEKTIIKGPYDGVVLSNAHLHPDFYFGQLPRVVSDLDESLPVLQPYARAAHVELGRVDLTTLMGDNTGMREDTLADLSNALSGRFTGATGNIMNAAREAPNMEYVALETAAASLAAQTKARNQHEIGLDYAMLGGHVREHFSA